MESKFDDLGYVPGGSTTKECQSVKRYNSLLSRHNINHPGHCILNALTVLLLPPLSLEQRTAAFI